MAMAAAGHEGHGDAVADLEAAHIPADGSDRAGKFVARHMRQRDVGIVPHPAMPVAAAKSGCLDLDDDAIGGGRGIGQGRDLRCLAEPFEIKRAHHASCSASRVIRSPICRRVERSEASKVHLRRASVAQHHQPVLLQGKRDSFTGLRQHGGGLVEHVEGDDVAAEVDLGAQNRTEEVRG